MQGMSEKSVMKHYFDHSNVSSPRRKSDKTADSPKIISANLKRQIDESQVSFSVTESNIDEERKVNEDLKLFRQSIDSKKSL